MNERDILEDEFGKMMSGPSIRVEIEAEVALALIDEIQRAAGGTEKTVRFIQHLIDVVTEGYPASRKYFNESWPPGIQELFASEREKPNDTSA